MSLRQKTLSIVGATLAGLLGVLYVTSSTILLGSLERAEEEHTRQTVQGVLSIFSQTEDDFNSRFADWSAWDDTYTFIEDANKTYIESNLVPEALANLKINLALFVNSKGKIVFGTGFDLKNRKNTPIPEALRRLLAQPLASHPSTKDPLLSHPSPNSSLSGILLLPSGPMLTISRPIVTSRGTGPIRGTLIFGRSLNTAQIDKLAQIARLPLSLHAINETHLPPDFQTAREDLLAAMRRQKLEGREILVRPLNKETIAGYTLLNDIYGQPAVMLRVEISREIYKQGQKSLLYLIASGAIAGLGFGSCTLILLERLVLSRLASLSADVSHIGKRRDVSLRLRITGTDELSSLGSTINEMLEALAQALLERQENEKRYRAVVEQASEGIFLFDVETKRILEANSAFGHLLGYSPAEMEKLTVYNIAAHEKESIDRNIDRILTEKHHSLGERRYRHREGWLIDVEVSANLIVYGGREILCTVVRDITERKQAEKALLLRSDWLRRQNQMLVELAKNTSLTQGDLHSACKLVVLAAAKILEVARASVWLYSDDRKTLYCIDLYDRDRQSHLQGEQMARADYPTYFAALEQERTIAAHDARCDRRTQELLAYFCEFAITSLLDAPIRVGGQVVGVVCHEHTGTPRDWTLDEQNFAGSIADLLSLSLEARDRQRAETALRQAEEKYRMIFENAIEGIFQTTPEGKYISANPALARIYGYATPAELIENLTAIDAQLYVNSNRRAEFVAAMQKGDAVSNFESQIYRQDGSTIWISENARAVRDNDKGALLYYEGTVEDITKRKVVEEALRYQKQQSERLLFNILPEAIAQRLQLQESTIADSFPAVTVMFADIVGFTELSAHISPTELVNLLNKIFSAFDLLTQIHGLEKIKTIGDAYMVVGGLPTPRSNHASAIADMAIDMQQAIESFNALNGHSLSIRIGINTGPVVAGVIGLKKFIYDLWGDTVNTASRMESHSLPGCIHVTEASYQLLQDQYYFEERGAISIKGKGEMTTYFLRDKREYSADPSISESGLLRSIEAQDAEESGKV